MARTDRFRIKRPEVIHQVLDGELVIVNLKTGAYFSLDRVGADIWHGIEGHATVGEVVGALRSRYDADAATIEAEVQRLTEELRREDLIAPYTGAVTPAGNALAAASNGRAVFSAPLLQKFTDMQEMLLLDPIHEVDDTGWPRRKD